MKVLLITVFCEESHKIEELGIASIAALLRRGGHEVIITGGRERYIDYTRVIDYRPDIIGGPVYIDSKTFFYLFCEKVKKALPDTCICAGGNFSSFNAREIMAEAPFIDFIVKGEGEITFLELLTAIEGKTDYKGIHGLVYRVGSEIMVNRDRELIEDLDNLPPPVRDFSIENHSKIVPVILSRGCMGGCNFCLDRQYWKKWRGRSIEKVSEELRYLFTLGFRHFILIGSSYNDGWVEISRLRELAQKIIDSKMNISYRLNLWPGFYQKADPTLVDLLKRSGLSLALVGIESGNEEDLELYGLPTTPEINSQCLEFFKKYRIPIDPGFINFNPYSTLERLKKNIDFLEQNRLSYNFYKIITRYQLLKGHTIYSMVVRDKLLKDGPYDDIYNYKFGDPRVEKLCEYLRGCYNKESQSMHGIISRGLYLAKLSALREKGESILDNKTLEIFHLHELEISEQLEHIGKKNASGFRELLDLAHHSWNEQKAGDIVEKFFNKHDLQKTDSKMKELGIRFLQEIYPLLTAYPSTSNIFELFFLDLKNN